MLAAVVLWAVQKQVEFASTEAFGDWSQAKPSELLADFPEKATYLERRSDWVFPLYARKSGAYRWSKATAEVRLSNGEWRTARLSDPALPISVSFGVPKEGEVRHFLFPADEGPAPTALRLALPSEAGGSPVRFLFEGNPNASRSEPQYREIQVRVLSPDGRPVQDTTAFLCGSYPSVDAVDTAIPVPVSEGTARMLVASAWAPPSLGVQAPGYGLTAIPFLEPSMEVRMRTSVRVSGRLLDGKGQPLKGIRFGVRSYDDPAPVGNAFSVWGRPFVLPSEIRNRFSGMTDANGKYWIDGLPPGAKVDLETEDKRLVVDPLREQTLLDEAEVKMPDLHVRMGATYSGRVHDRLGYVPRASVVLIGSQGEQYSASTDDAGYFNVVRLPAGNYGVVVFTAGEKPDVEGRFWIRIRLEPGDIGEV